MRTWILTTWILYLLMSLYIPDVVNGNEMCRFGDGCTFSCHCKNNAPCDPHTGQCEECDDGLRPEEQDFNSGAWWGDACQKGNIAYGKPSTQLGTYGSYIASHAVDGYKGFPFQDAYCSNPYSKDQWTPTWWRVDLVDQHLIYNVTILHRAEDDGTPTWLVRLWNTYIGVGNFSTPDETYHVQCAFIKEEDPDFNYTTNTVIKQCVPNLVGRYVSLQRTGNNNIDSMNFCEVYVTGYKVAECSGSWGPGCLTPCNCVSQCHLVTGYCNTTCLPGWTGPNCQEECQKGYWGQGCNKSCNCKEEENGCNRFNGSCSSGCKKGFAGKDCYSSLFHLNQKNQIMTKSEPSAIIYFMSWDPSLNDTIKPDLYIVEYQKTSESNWTEGLTVNHEKDGDIIEVTVKNLEENTEYNIQVLPSVQEMKKMLNNEQNLMITGGVVGAVLGIIVIVLIIVLVIVFRRKRKKSPSDENRQTSAMVKSEKMPEVTTPEVVPQAVDMVVVEETSQEDKDEPAEVRDRESMIYENTVKPILPETKPILVSELASYIRTRKEQDGFKEEYEEIPQDPVAPWETGILHPNKDKNRFINIRAYDHSRVVLEKESEDDFSDYINANYIKGYKDLEKHYIATQGPRKHNINDLWRMIWEVDANRIVMVTNLIENGKNKCEQYWPSDRDPESYGDVTVRLIHHEALADFHIRDFSVSSKGKSRTVRHFHFSSWPDHGVPTHATALLEFRRRIHSYDSQATGPMIVHCSAGVGRTGTFIAIDYLMEQARREQMVDVFACVLMMRQDRIKMVQTLDQYVFVHDALLEALMSGETAIPAAKFHSHLAVLKQSDDLMSQYNVLETLKRQKKSGANVADLKKENRIKNRDPEIVPYTVSRPALITKVPETNDYINATYVNGYKSKRAYLVTQAPLPNTCADIWRLVWDHKCNSIVMLNELDEKKGVPAYWPSGEETTLTFGPLNINYEGEKTINAELLSRQYEIVHTKKKNSSPSKIQQFVLQCWPEGADTPTSMSAVLELLAEVEKWQQQTGNGPIIIHCINGASRSGLLVAAMYMLDKLKVDQEVDVFQSVKSIRINRPQLVTNMEQYIFLHDLAAEFMNRFVEYANFK